MQVVAPDLIEQARGLSAGVCGVGVAVGLLLWLTGWAGHRFWIVLATTLSAGLFGLLSPGAGKMPPVVIGLLLAVAAGVLALALVRVIAFGAGGAAAWLAVRALAPPDWHEPLVCFLAGGLVGLVLFRVWMMALSSFAGALIMAYSGLCLADSLGKLNAVDVAGQQGTLLTVLCGVLTVVGLLVQFVLDRRRIRNERWREHRSRYLSEDEMDQYYRRRWWGGSKPRSYRRAG